MIPIKIFFIGRDFQDSIASEWVFPCHSIRRYSGASTGAAPNKIQFNGVGGIPDLHQLSVHWGASGTVIVG